MANELVSILIPVYNRADLVGETISSALRQTYEPVEVVICDNASTDDTWSVLEKFAKGDERIRIFRNERNLGPVKNWERCISLARGEYSKILFSDDLMESTFIEHTLSIFDNETAFVFTPTQEFREAVQESMKKNPFQEVYESGKYLEEITLSNMSGFPVSPGCAIFRTHDLKGSLEVDIPNKLGINFNDFGAGNDLLLFLNTALRYKYVKVYPKAESYFRFHKNSITISNRLDFHYDFARLYFIEKNMKPLKSKFKTLHWMRKLRKREECRLLEMIDGPINPVYGVAFLIRYYLKTR